MRKTGTILAGALILAMGISMAGCNAKNQELRSQEEILESMTHCNAYFMEKWPDVGKRIVTNRDRASNIWTRAVYYEGLMELNKIDPRTEYYDYAVRWGEFHEWNLRDGQTYTRNADNQCAGQTYIDLYLMDPKPERIAYIKASVDSMLRTDKIDDWDWIDALADGHAGVCTTRGYL